MNAREEVVELDSEGRRGKVRERERERIVSDVTARIDERGHSVRSCVRPGC